MLYVLLFVAAIEVAFAADKDIALSKPALSADREAQMRRAEGSARQKIIDAQQLMTERRYQEATLLLQDAVDADPGNAEALLELGNVYAAQAYFQQAVQKWDRAIQMSTDFRLRARAQERIDEIGTARAALAKVSDTSDDGRDKFSQAREAYVGAVKRMEEQNYSGAIDALDQAIRLAPAFAPAYVARGSANIALNHFLQAAADYERALRLDPKLSSSLYGLGEAYRALGRRAEARQFYRQYAVSQAPDARPELQQEARQKAENLQ